MKSEVKLTKNPNMLKKIFKKGATTFNKDNVQEFMVNLTALAEDGDSNDLAVKRTIKDFRKLVVALDKTFFGRYVPFIPKIQATEEISESIINHRLNNIE